MMIKMSFLSNIAGFFYADKRLSFVNGNFNNLVAQRYTLTLSLIFTFFGNGTIYKFKSLVIRGVQEVIKMF